MAEVALIGVGTAAATWLAELVAARALDEIKLAWGLEDELEKLRKKFEYVQALLYDAGNSKYAQKSNLVNLWVQKVKDVAYLADDVMDECSIEIFRKKMEPKSRFKRLADFSTTSSRIFSHKERKVIAKKVKDILSRFDEIDKDAACIGLRQVDIAVTATSNNDDQLSLNRQRATANASNFVGRKDDLEKLLDCICSPSNYNGVGLSTVAIVGMGGVGKTALTRHIYDDEKISAYFGSNKIWICVSQNFEMNRLLNEMVELVTLRESKLLNTDAIIIKLQEELKGKKFLIVFDDVWNSKEDLWDNLKGWFDRIGCAPGSVFLFNTCSYEVADAAGAFVKHKIKGLSNHESWTLLYNLIVSTNNPIGSTLEKVGRRIIEKCKGVPSMIEVIGNSLRSKQHLHEWESIEDLLNSPHNQNQILPSLLLSFNQLSPSLKQCFAYCAMIPKGSYVCKSDLISLWLSQGYLRSEGTSLTMEEIGEKNLKILLGNSFLEECVSLEPGIVGYKMHDFVYALAVYVCGSELIKEMNDLRGTGSCRHLVLNTTLDFPPETDLKKLRTLGLSGTFVPWYILTHTSSLRTLKLDHTGITEVPPTIELLKHLRFLDVSYNPISTLPDSMSKLYQLQTLILRGCINMKKLPKVVNNLVNLRHISTTAPMFACKGLQQLTNLQSLPCLSLNDNVEGWSIDELGDLHELKNEIHIRGLECLKDADKGKKADLSGKTDVSKLTLFWAEERKLNDDVKCDEVVLGALEPHLNLTSLEVQNFNGVRFPIWIMGMAVLAKGQGGNRIRLNHLTTVKLLNCSRCQTLPKLGHLPLLKCLVLSGLHVDHIGIEFYGGADYDRPGVVAFISLEKLEISGFRRLRTWMEPPKAAFPSLQTLQIRDCNRLNSVPAFESNSLVNLELKHLNSVDNLDILKYSLGLTSLVMDMLPKITNLPQELANCKKLHILSISNCDGLVLLPGGLKLIDNGEGCTILEFRDEIHIMGLECVKDKEQAMIVGSAVKKNVSRLILSLTEGREENNGVIADERVLKGLDPHPNITSLELKNFTGTRFPIWIMRMAVRTKEPTNKWTQLNNLTTFKLLNCTRCQTLPRLGQLPSLKCLSMSGLDSVEHIGNEFYGGDDLDMPGMVSFNCLKVIEISGFRTLISWVEAPKGAFPSLETLQLRDCNRLNSVPVFESNSLVNLELKHLNNVEDLDILKYSLGLTSLILDMLPKITSLPQKLANCKKLKILTISGCDRLVSLPKGFGYFLNHQSVIAPNVQHLLRLSLSDEEGWCINKLEDEIHITGLECVKDKEQAKRVGFVAKANISRLTLAWARHREVMGSGITDELVLQAFDPHPNITSLELKNFTGAMFPVWITRTPLNNLTTIKLLNCFKCRTLPRLGQLPFLECLILDGFNVEIIGLEFYGDLTMRAVPFECLKELEISRFFRLTAWVEPPKEAFPHLETLRIRECWYLISISTFDTKSLLTLELHELGNIDSLDFLRYSSGLTSLTLTKMFKITSLPHYRNLQTLNLTSLHKLASLDILRYSSGRLTVLTLNYLPKIRGLLQELANCRNLQILKLESLSGCCNLQSLKPMGLESFVNLKEIRLYDCHNIEFLKSDLLHLRSSLRVFYIREWNRVRKIPTNLEEFISLETLVILNSPRGMEGLPTNVSKLGRLVELRMCFTSARQLRSVVESAKDLPLLRILEIECACRYSSQEHEEMRECLPDMIPFLRLPSLRELELTRFSTIKSLPQQLGLLTQITTLTLDSFLELEEIPDWICNLSSLVSLTLGCCYALKRLPSKKHMHRLTCLKISSCSILKKIYDKNRGSEWHNISHINQIWMDNHKIQHLCT